MLVLGSFPNDVVHTVVFAFAVCVVCFCVCCAVCAVDAVWDRGAGGCVVCVGIVVLFCVCIVKFGRGCFCFSVVFACIVCGVVCVVGVVWDGGVGDFVVCVGIIVLSCVSVVNFGCGCFCFSFCVWFVWVGIPLEWGLLTAAVDLGLFLFLELPLSA